MSAWGIEELSTVRGVTEFRVLNFPYRWQLTKWVAEKPEKRRAAKPTDKLDRHLTLKAQKTSRSIQRDNRRMKA